MKDLTRLLGWSGVNHGILVAFTFFLVFGNSVLCERYTLYVNQGKSASLYCGLKLGDTDERAGDQIVWSFRPFGGGDNKKIECSGSDGPYVCSFPKAFNGSVNSTLEIKKVSDGDYGMYLCSVSNNNATISLKDVIRPTIRQYEGYKWVVAKGLRVEVEAKLELNCFINVTGDEYEVKWKWVPEDDLLEDIAEDNDSMYKYITFGEMGPFQNFTEKKYEDSTAVYGYEGAATFDLRGSYMCEVHLKNLNESNLHSMRFPEDAKSPKTFVRVVDQDRWILPGMILLGEVILLGIFTLIINLKEMKQGAIDGDYADSEDEDEPKKEN